MMKAILGSALGGVVAGAVALVASAQGRAPAEALTSPPASAASYAVADAGTRAVAAAAPQASTAVQCEPSQEAVLQRSFVSGREVAQVTCVFRQPAGYAPLPASGVVPVAMGSYLPPAASPDIVERPVTRTVYTAPRVQRASARRQEIAPKRSWKKSALVIGGSAGAGAGIGALAGGKKGALIGAAIGGGSGAIYEAVKRR